MIRCVCVCVCVRVCVCVCVCVCLCSSVVHSSIDLNSKSSRVWTESTLLHCPTNTFTTSSPLLRTLLEPRTTSLLFPPTHTTHTSSRHPRPCDLHTLHFAEFLLPITQHSGHTQWAQLPSRPALPQHAVPFHSSTSHVAHSFQRYRAVVGG